MQHVHFFKHLLLNLHKMSWKRNVLLWCSTSPPFSTPSAKTRPVVWTFGLSLVCKISAFHIPSCVPSRWAAAGRSSLRNAQHFSILFSPLGGLQRWHVKLSGNDTSRAGKILRDDDTFFHEKSSCQCHSKSGSKTEPRVETHRAVTFKGGT